MQVTSSIPQTVKGEKKYPGVMEVEYEHKITETKVKVNYIGPKISHNEWNKMLAFFKWCYDETHSECQVRWYLNLAEQRWVCWAYPQEARTGMSAREIAGPLADGQRALFSDDWVYSGTSHHHCNGGAFQSGVDLNNERDQDGLHFTIGKMGEKHYDLHARFYLNKQGFEPDMSLFWDIGDQVRDLIPAELHHKVAVHQMTIPAPADTVVPEIWKSNLIEIKSVPVKVNYPYSHGTETAPGFFGPGAGANTGGNNVARMRGSSVNTHSYPSFNLETAAHWVRAKMASDTIAEWGATNGYDYDDMYSLMDWINRQDDLRQVISAAVKYRVNWYDLWQEFPRTEPFGYDELLKEFHQLNQAKRKSKKKNKGEPERQLIETDGKEISPGNPVIKLPPSFEGTEYY